MRPSIDDRILWHDADHKSEILPYQVVHEYDGNLVLQYDGAFNADPGGMLVAEPHFNDEDEGYYLNGTLYQVTPVDDRNRKAHFPHMSETATFHVFIFTEVQ